VNDARVDVPTPGSSSVEAYEEDWYRSLRALAERRRGELEQLDDEDAETSADDRTETAAHEPGDVWAVRPAEAGDEAAAGSPDAETSDVSDAPRSDEADPASSLEASAAGTSQPATMQHIDEPVGRDHEDAADASVDASGGAGDEATAPPSDEAVTPVIPDAVAPTTPPWARVLRPLERLDLAPLAGEDTGDVEDRATDEAGSIATEGQALDDGDRIEAVETDASPDFGRPIAHEDPPTLGSDAPVENRDASQAPEIPDVDSPAEGASAIEDDLSDVVTVARDGSLHGGPSLENHAMPDDGEPGAGDALDVVELPPPNDDETGRVAEVDTRTHEAPSDVIDAEAPAPSDDATGEPAPASEVATPPTEPRDAGTVSDTEVTATFEPEPEAEPEAAEAEPEPEQEPEPEAVPEAEPEPEGPSLTSRDPVERRTALEELSRREAGAAELDTVAALILDPDAEIRRLAVETLARAPARLDDAVVRQALQDPADEVRAAAVRAAATRGVRDLPTLAPLVDARRSPQTHRAVLELLPKILGEAQLTAETLDPLLLAVAQMQPPPDETERAAMSEIAASIGATLLVEGLMLPDARRLGAVRLLAGDHSHAVLHALAERAGDPLEEVRQAGLAAAEEIARIEEEAARAAGPPDIGALAEDLRNPDPEHVERALTSLAEVERHDVVTWCRERLARADAESVATVASVAAVLDLNEIGVELLTRGAALPSERRRPVIEALAEFPDASQLAGFLAVVAPDRRADAVRLVWEASGRRVLPDLRSLLADPAVEVRVAVIDIARDADDPASIEAVAGLLATDASPEVRAAAVRAIASSEGELPNVIRALGDPDPHVRTTAVESMPSAPAVEVGPVLAQALTDLDERVRLAAIERLAGVSSSEPALAWSALRQCRVEERDELLNAFQRTNPNLVLEIALEHLYSPDQEERRLAVEMTGWGASQAAVESAIRALGDPVPDVRRAAVGALGRLRDRSAVAALGKTLADPDADVRVGAVRALGVIDDEGVLAFLVAALKDPDHRVRETTSHVLTEWSSPAVAKRLAGVLAVPSLRESAADLLRRIGPTSVELLIDVLIQGSAEIRHTVGPLLEQIIGIDEFLGRMDSLEPERRLRAIEALGAIAGPLAVDALMRSLSDPDERIRLRATQLLGELGDPIAADAVRRLVDDPVPDVATAARYALETNLDSRAQDRPTDNG
jgi:HEAT repeat protein